MGRVSCHLSLSLDGFIAGPDQSRDNPVGVGGRVLLGWHQFAGGDRPVDVEATDELLRPMGAYIMGRNMYGPIRGPWSGDWLGWWGDDPPYHVPVFVLTHHARDPVTMAGGTVFHFVTDGFDAAVRQARETAGDADIRIAGGASTVRQALAAGVLDDLHLDILPVVLGSGESPFEGPAEFRQREVAHSPVATHISYRLRD